MDFLRNLPNFWGFKEKKDMSVIWSRGDRHKARKNCSGVWAMWPSAELLPGVKTGNCLKSSLSPPTSFQPCSVFPCCAVDVFFFGLTANKITSWRLLISYESLALV